MGKFEKIYKCKKVGKDGGGKNIQSLKRGSKSLIANGPRQKAASPCLCLVGGAAF